MNTLKPSPNTRKKVREIAYRITGRLPWRDYKIGERTTAIPIEVEQTILDMMAELRGAAPAVFPDPHLARRRGVLPPRP